MKMGFLKGEKGLIVDYTSYFKFVNWEEPSEITLNCLFQEFIGAGI